MCSSALFYQLQKLSGPSISENVTYIHCGVTTAKCLLTMQLYRNDAFSTDEQLLHRSSKSFAVKFLFILRVRSEYVAFQEIVLHG